MRRCGHRSPCKARCRSSPASSSRSANPEKGLNEVGRRLAPGEGFLADTLSKNDGSACNLWTPDLAKTPAYLAPTKHLFILTFLVVAQGLLHFPEHIAQFYQRFYLGKPADGLLGQLNVEWVHVIYNWGLLALMIPVLVGCGFFSRKSGWSRYNKVAAYALLFSFWLQVWHAFEHYAKLAQYYHNLAAKPPILPAGGPNAPGLVGEWLKGPWGVDALVMLHFLVNLLVLIPIVYAFFAFDVPGALKERLWGSKQATSGASVS